MNAQHLLELSRRWHALAELATVGSLDIASAMAPIELAQFALDVARTAMAIASQLEELARRHELESRRD